MSAVEPRLERLQILVPTEQKRRMRREAERLGVSVSELYRRSADAYAAADGDQTIDHPELEALVEVLRTSVARATKSMDRADREVRATIDFFNARQQQRETSS